MVYLKSAKLCIWPPRKHWTNVFSLSLSWACSSITANAEPRSLQYFSAANWINHWLMCHISPYKLYGHTFTTKKLINSQNPLRPQFFLMLCHGTACFLGGKLNAKCTTSLRLTQSFSYRGRLQQWGGLHRTVAGRLGRRPPPGSWQRSVKSQPGWPARSAGWTSRGGWKLESCQKTPRCRHSWLRT